MPIDFAAFRAQMEALSDASLAFTLADIAEARDNAEAMCRAGLAAEGAAGKYADQLHTALEVRNARRST